MMWDARMAAHTLYDHHSVKLQGVVELQVQENAINNTSSNVKFNDLKDAVRTRMKLSKGELLTFLDNLDMGKDAEREGMDFITEVADLAGNGESGRYYVATCDAAMEGLVKAGSSTSPFKEQHLHHRFREYCASLCYVLRPLHLRIQKSPFMTKEWDLRCTELTRFRLAEARSSKHRFDSKTAKQARVEWTMIERTL